jgi:protein-S-isoprenylcysteine O-methyltransferase Ste14
MSSGWVKLRCGANVLLFSVTLAELTFLLFQTPMFTFVDWIYVSQHLLVLVIAFTRRQPVAQDYSLPTNVAVGVSYAYPYAQVALLQRIPGAEGWPTGGLVLVTIAAFLSVASLLTLRRSFGIRPALRGLVTAGPYRFVRHPIYLSYAIGDIGYNLQEWNYGTVLLTLAGWVSLLYRIHAEERVLSRDPGWRTYVAAVPRRVLPLPRLWNSPTDQSRVSAQTARHQTRRAH